MTLTVFKLHTFEENFETIIKKPLNKYSFPVRFIIGSSSNFRKTFSYEVLYEFERTDIKSTILRV